MTDSSAPRRPRRTTAIIVAVLVLVIAAVVVLGLLAAHGSPTASPSTSSPVALGSTPATAPASVAASPTSSAATPSARASTPAPQATKTTSLTATAPIQQRLTASVTKTEAVQGTAQGPGEIAGPAVRFTIVVTNTTGKTVNLSNTVVNAYYGKQSTPAVELQSPGGASFPQSVANGRSARGVFIFNIPKNQRSTVVVTVDTSVKNPVVAFRGTAPQ